MARILLLAVLAGLSAPPAALAQAVGGWESVKDANGQVKALIEVSTIRRDRDGNAHAKICLLQGETCPVQLRWFFNCRDHSYSPIDTTITPSLPHEMNPAQPGSVADQLADIACNS